MTEKTGITAANWNQPENVAMSFQQVQRLFPSLRLEHNLEARLCLGWDEQNVLGKAMIGPVSRLIAGQEPALLEKVFASMEEVLAPYYGDGALNLPGAIWFVTATTD
jgi:hypothetical protein